MGDASYTLFAAAWAASNVPCGVIAGDEDALSLGLGIGVKDVRKALARLLSEGLLAPAGTLVKPEGGTCTTYRVTGTGAAPETFEGDPMSAVECFAALERLSLKPVDPRYEKEARQRLDDALASGFSPSTVLTAYMDYRSTLIRSREAGGPYHPTTLSRWLTPGWATAEGGTYNRWLEEAAGIALSTNRDGNRLPNDRSEVVGPGEDQRPLARVTGSGQWVALPWRGDDARLVPVDPSATREEALRALGDTICERRG